MKKSYLFLAVTFVLLMVIASFKSPAPTNPIPDDLGVIFKNSCMACHSNEGGMIARSKVNFSVWNTYDVEKQSKKAIAICNVVTKGSMPTKSFIKSNPGAALTNEQKALICKWSEELNPKK